MHRGPVFDLSKADGRGLSHPRLFSCAANGSREVTHNLHGTEKCWVRAPSYRSAITLPLFLKFE